MLATICHVPFAVGGLFGVWRFYGEAIVCSRKLHVSEHSNVQCSLAFPSWRDRVELRASEVLVEASDEPLELLATSTRPF